jgi:hypothetical protein
MKIGEREKSALHEEYHEAVRKVTLYFSLNLFEVPLVLADLLDV